MLTAADWLSSFVMVKGVSLERLSFNTYTGQRARRGGLWFSLWAPDRAVLVSSPGRVHSLTVPLSTQVYKWVPAILLLKPGVIPAMNYHPI